MASLKSTWSRVDIRISLHPSVTLAYTRNVIANSELLIWFDRVTFLLRIIATFIYCKFAYSLSLSLPRIILPPLARQPTDQCITVLSLPFSLLTEHAFLSNMSPSYVISSTQFTRHYSTHTIFCPLKVTSHSLAHSNHIYLTLLCLFFCSFYLI